MSRTWFVSVFRFSKEKLGEARQHSDRLHQYTDTIPSAWDSSILPIEPDKIKIIILRRLFVDLQCRGMTTIEERLTAQTSSAEALKERLKRS